MSRGKDKELLKKLEKHIRNLGNKFRVMANDYFWSESDLQCMLLTSLHRDPSFSYQPENKDIHIPLVHSELPNGIVNGPNERRRFDLVILDEGVSKEVAKEKSTLGPTRIDGREAGGLEMFCKLLCAVEIKYLFQGGRKWREKIEEDIEKLSQTKERFSNCYELVFVLTEFRGKQKHNYKEIEQYIEGQYNEWNNKIGGLKVFCFPGDLDLKHQPLTWPHTE